MLSDILLYGDGSSVNRLTRRYANGDRFEGEWMDDEVHGHGELLTSDNDRSTTKQAEKAS